MARLNRRRTDEPAVIRNHCRPGVARYLGHHPGLRLDILRQKSATATRLHGSAGDSGRAGVYRDCREWRCVVEPSIEALVIVCQQCGNYPLVTAPAKRSIIERIDDIVYYLGEGLSLRQIEMTAAERKKILKCGCWD